MNDRLALLQVERIIALGYYDGPTEGLAEYDGTAFFFFETLATDIERERRVVRLREITGVEFEMIAREISQTLGGPRWPVWVPRWEFEDDEVQVRLEKMIARVSGEARTVAAAECNEAMTTCFRVRPLNDRECTEVTNWFTFMEGN